MGEAKPWLYEGKAVDKDSWIKAAGLRDKYDRLEHLSELPTCTWQIPDEIDDIPGGIVWSCGGSQPTQAVPGANLLNDFLDLSNADDARVLAFVRKWGPLRLCPNGFPETRAACAICSEREGRQINCLCPVFPRSADELDTPDKHYESYEMIRVYACVAKAMIIAGGALKMDSPEMGRFAGIESMARWSAACATRNLAQRSDTVAINLEYGSDAPVGQLTRDEGLDATREWLVAALRNWSRVGGVTYEPDWEQNHAVRILRCNSLFGAIGFLIEKALGENEGPLCSICGSVIDQRGNAPAINRRRLCGDPACAKEAGRRRKRDERDRKRASGASIAR